MTMNDLPEVTATLGAAVELRVSADLAHLPVLRAVPETIAVLGEFNLDEVSDVMLAVDEVCSELIKDSVLDARLTCRYELSDGVLHVLVFTITRTGQSPREDSFGWHVLRVLTDSISVIHAPLGAQPNEYLTTVEFKKRGGDV